MSPTPESPPPSLPARVRVSRLPLPPAPAVQLRLKALFSGQSFAEPDSLFSQLRAGAVAVAGGKIIGAALSGLGAEGQLSNHLELESGWRGRGIEEALLELLTPEQPLADPPLTEQP